jgi:putative ABC transport system ATP-binding protein
MTEPETRIELTSVSKAYGTQQVLDDASLVIEPAEFVAVMGRSGSGKSTLLKLIGGLSAADSGSIKHGRHDLADMNEHERTEFRRRELGFVFQFFNLVPTLTVTENVLLPLALNRRDSSASQRRVAELLDQLGLAACSKRLPDELSGGEQQRVAIARALAHEPALVITDEPTGNLDIETADEVLRLLTESCRGHRATLIMATHSRDAAALADRTVHIRSGKVEQIA